MILFHRYLNFPLSSTLTVGWLNKPGRDLKVKLCGYLRPKCHPIFYDSNINSAAVVRLNIYQAFLLCAMKFHCYISDLSSICRFSTKFYADALGKSLRYETFSTSSLVRFGALYILVVDLNWNTASSIILNLSSARVLNERGWGQGRVHQYLHS